MSRSKREPDSEISPSSLTAREAPRAVPSDHALGSREALIPRD